MEVTVNLPESVYHQAAWLAQLMDSDVVQVLAETIEGALSPLGSPSVDMTPVQELPDSVLLATADLRLPETQGERLGQLLDQQQRKNLNEAERNELTALMQVYHEYLVCKAQALREAVRRGLREPLAE